MAQISLYYSTLLETNVSLLPEQIDGNLDEHLLTNLKKAIEGRANSHGIVLKINRIIDYDYGIIDQINFMGTTVYNVKYECFLCSPTKNLEIVCIVDNIIKKFLLARNGPVQIAVQFHNIDTQRFKVVDNDIINIKTNDPLKKGDYIKVSIININNNMGKKTIMTICKLINIAEEEEIDRFKKDQLMINNGSDNDDEFI